MNEVIICDIAKVFLKESVIESLFLRMLRRIFLLTSLLTTSLWAQTFLVDTRSIMVCGDSYVHLVDPAKSEGTKPHVIWTWDAREVKDLPEEYRTKKFRSVDDVKPVRGGSQLLISSSSQGVVLWDVKENKTLFYTSVGNAHSIELLPNGLVAAAASTHAEGNQMMLFDPASGDSKPIATDELYSGHGAVWHEGRQTLFGLGYDVLVEYEVKDRKLKRVNEWKIPGQSGHDLTLSPDGKRFLLTEHTGAWQFDLESEKFSKIPNFPDAENIKSLNLAKNGQYLYTVPEEQWWTHTVSLHEPTQRLAFPGMRVYKARFYKE